MDSLWTVVVATLAAILGGSGAVIVSLLTRKKMLSESRVKNAESADIIEGAATSLVTQYKEDAARVRGQYDELELNMKECVKEIKGLKAKLQVFETRHSKLLDVVERLVHQIRSLNHAPVCEAEIIGEAE
jgi:hypothetical protein